MSTPKASDTEAVEKLQAFVIQQIKAGADRPTIASKVAELGVDRQAATPLVDAMYTSVMRAAKAEQADGSALLPALAGALMAAGVGGAVWGLLVIWTGYEIGYVAWGLGVLSGLAVVKLTGGKKGVPLQILAVLSSVLGILIGKYLTFFHVVKEQIGEEYGADAAAKVTMFSGFVMRVFGENITAVLSGFDALWVVLAVLTAWRIPKGMGITPSPYEPV